MDGRSKTGEPSWQWRRLLVYGTVAICAAEQFALILWGKDTAVNATIAEGSFWTLVAMVMTYTGAATTQDIIAIWTMRTARPYADNPVPVDPPPPDQTVVVQPVVMQPPAEPKE